MSLPQPSVEFSPLQPEPQGPELRLVQGGGEGAPDAVQPELYAVPDPVNQIVDEAGHENVAGEDDNVELTTLRERAANQASQLLGVVRSGKSLGSGGSELAGISYDHHKRGGGGGWAIREYLRKLAAKAKAEAENHESGCVCQVCRNL